jgi:hypothetical protein
MSFTIIFSPVYGIFSHSLDTECHRAKVLDFNKVQVINIFVSWIMLLELYLKTHCTTHYSFRNLIVLCLQFRFVIHFKLLFVRVVRNISTFIFFSCRGPVVIASADYSFPVSFALLPRPIVYICAVLFLMSCFCYIDHVSILLLTLQCLDQWRFIVRLEPGSVSLLLCFSSLFYWLFWCFTFHSVYNIHKILCWNLTEIVLNLQINLVRTNILTMLNILIQTLNVSL